MERMAPFQLSTAQAPRVNPGELWPEGSARGGPAVREGGQLRLAGWSLHQSCPCRASAAQVRSARLQEARAQREYEEMKECTFTPEVNKGPPPKPVGAGLAAG